ncbi:MAG: HIT family protein [Chitinophagales bacterium]|nr:HIT family protein [Chitinophagales bacterium]
MSSIFSKIIAGEIPSHKVGENEYCYSFLDINPIAKGHTLVVPKKEVDYIFDLDDPAFSELFLFSKKIAKAIEKEVDCLRIGVAVIGLEVPHAHIHLVPLKGMHDIDFSKEKLQFTQEELSKIAKSIATHL